jgi:hypothetical protein
VEALVKRGGCLRSDSMVELVTVNTKGLSDHEVRLGHMDSSSSKLRNLSPVEVSRLRALYCT